MQIWVTCFAVRENEFAKHALRIGRQRHVLNTGKIGTTSRNSKEALQVSKASKHSKHANKRATTITSQRATHQAVLTHEHGQQTQHSKQAQQASITYTHRHADWVYCVHRFVWAEYFSILTSRKHSRTDCLTWTSTSSTRSHISQTFRSACVGVHALQCLNMARIAFESPGPLRLYDFLVIVQLILFVLSTIIVFV